MDDLSIKNSTFVKECIDIIKSVDYKKHEEKIIKMINRHKEYGTRLSFSEVSEIIDELRYCKEKIYDITASINLYTKNVSYEEVDFNEIKNSVNNNVYIYGKNISTIVNESSIVLPEFQVYVGNLGYSDITNNDSLNLKLYNNDIGLSFDKEYKFKSNLSLGDKYTFVIRDFPCPSNTYNFLLEASIKKEDIYFSKTLLATINIV